MQTSDPAAPFPLRRYHVARGGQNAGVFSAAELRAKRASVEFTGGELIWRPGMNTGRFDTYVPDQLYHATSDIERDMELPNGKHIYGRKDIWPHLRRMYEGYTAEKSPSVVAWREGWRSAYACEAFIAEDYATARRRLEAVDWKPAPGEHPEWDIDLSFMPLEVAARTGSQAELATRAEAAWDRGDTSEAKALFQKVAAAADDERTREFARRRVAGAEGAGF